MAVTGVGGAVRYRRLVLEGEPSIRRKNVRLIVALVVFVLASVAVAVAVGLLRAGGDEASPAAERGGMRSDTSTLEARFATLSRATSNQCGLQRERLESIANHGRLQGSCCFPMNFDAYRHQLEGLKRYAGIEVIPNDPYDIPVPPAKRLIAYQAIVLTAKAESEIQPGD